MSYKVFVTTYIVHEDEPIKQRKRRARRMHAKSNSNLQLFPDSSHEHANVIHLASY
jgi:hypothetical protein